MSTSVKSSRTWRQGAIDGIDDSNEKNAARQELDKIMNEPARSTARDGGDRHYSDLLESKFEVNVYRIERQADKRDIYGKAFDFTADTIKELLEQGENETVDKIEWQ